MMNNGLPQLIKSLPEAKAPFPGCQLFLSQAAEHQIVFMEFTEDTVVPEHSHAPQWEFVLAGQVEMTINGEKRVYNKGEGFVIEAGVPHSAKIPAGYASFAYFEQKDRYTVK